GLTCGGAKGENTRWAECWPWRSVRCLVGPAASMRSSQWGQDCGPELRATLGLKRERGPSGSTVHRSFGRWDQVAFERVLGQWGTAPGLQAGEAIASDGKTLRGMHGEAVPGVHLVAAFAHQTRMVLAQAARQGNGHEVAGVQAVLAAFPGRLLCGHVVSA